MEEQGITKKEIRQLAKITKHKCDLLITQCDSWLPEEEGRKNVAQHFRNREKEKRKKWILKIVNWILN